MDVFDRVPKTNITGDFRNFPKGAMTTIHNILDQVRGTFAGTV